MKPVEELLPYKIASFLDAHKGTAYDLKELNALVLPNSPFGTLETIIRKLVRGKTVYMAGQRATEFGARRYTYASHGNAARIFELERNLKTEARRREPVIKPLITKNFIQTALNAHPLHSWRGV